MLGQLQANSNGPYLLQFQGPFLTYDFAVVPRDLWVLGAVEFCWHDTVSMVVRRRPLFANSKGSAGLIAEIQEPIMSRMAWFVELHYDSDMTKHRQERSPWQRYDRQDNQQIRGVGSLNFLSDIARQAASAAKKHKLSPGMRCTSGCVGHHKTWLWSIYIHFWR